MTPPPPDIAPPEANFVERAKQASAEAKAALNDFEVKGDGPERTFFNEPIDANKPTFEERADAASEQGKGAGEWCRQQLGT